jgi:hypothetical protein
VQTPRFRLCSSAPRRDDFAAKVECCLPCRCLILLVLLLGLSARSATATELHNTPDAPAGSGLGFAIADFDGDHIPDLASIREDSSTDYWIQVQFSASARQAIRLVAPAGGLLVEARDVNGDNIVDLVFTTSVSKLPVAVLLNNGHGSFSRAEPTSFPEAFSHSEAKLNSRPNQMGQFSGILSESSVRSCAGPADLSDVQLNPGSIRHSRQEFVAGGFLLSHAGRAPPLRASWL